MPVDDGLRSAFNTFTAESEKLSSWVRRTDSQPAISHLSPAARDATRASIQDNILVLSQGLEQLEIIEQSLRTIRACMTRIRIHSILAISLVEALPLEIIQNIAQSVVQSPEDRSQIIKLSHVSRTWRTAILGISKFFVSPNWTRWSQETLDEWCLRAGRRHLVARLCECVAPKSIGLERFSHGCRCLGSVSERLVSLHIDVHGACENAIPIVRTLLEGTMPCLRHLSVLSEETPPVVLDLVAGWTPSLVSLKIWGCDYRFEDSYPHLESLGLEVASHPDFESLSDLLSGSPPLSHLTLSEWPYTDFIGTPPSLSLPNLLSLQLRNFRSDNRPYLADLFKAMVAPNLLTIEVIKPDISFLDELLLSMPTLTSNRVESLILVSVDSSCVEEIVELLTVVDSEGLLLVPNLRELVLQYPKNDVPSIGRETASLLIKLAELRHEKLRRLVLSTLLEPDLVEALAEDAVLDIGSEYELDDHGL